MDALRLRWPLFTGRKIIAVVTGMVAPGQDQPALPLANVGEVERYLPPGAEVIPVPNDQARWELASWPLLWERVLATAHPEDAILYAHSKGVTRPPSSTSHRWADMLYGLALDHWPLVEDALRRHPIAGPLRKWNGGFYAPPFEGHLRPQYGQSHWHFSGNFWWARVEAMRERLATVQPPPGRWGCEAWPGIAFKQEEAADVGPPTWPHFHLYNGPEMDRLEQSLHGWLAANPPSPAWISSSAGNGATPGGDGLRLSIVIPTTGRPSLARTLDSLTPQLRPGDEVIVERDNTGDWGATPRTRGMRRASGDWILWMDDDDCYTEGALHAVRRAVAKSPGRPHIFGMRRGRPFNNTLPVSREVRVGNVSTQMLVIPNDQARLGQWGTMYEGDFSFLVSTLALYPPDSLVWRDEVIAIWRPA